MRQPDELHRVPSVTKDVFDAIVQITDCVCNEHLTAEYAALARRLTAALARKRPSPLLKGTQAMWACGIVYALGSTNFLFDPTQELHMQARDLCALFGVSQSGASAKSRDILQMLDIMPMDPDWCLPSHIGDNPFVWLIEVDGISVDARMLPRELQEMAWRAGVIPYIYDDVHDKGQKTDKSEPAPRKQITRKRPTDDSVEGSSSQGALDF
jgi:hypothetical protein